MLESVDFGIISDIKARIKYLNVKLHIWKKLMEKCLFTLIFY